MKKLLALILMFTTVGAANATEKKPLTNLDKLNRFEKTINNYILKANTSADKCEAELKRIKSSTEPSDQDLKIYKGCYVRAIK